MSIGENCTDNRFELIDKYKKRLIEATNIETDEDEMKVIDNILFRFWQMKWLNALEKQIPREIDKYKFKPLNTWVYFCHTCNSMVDQRHSNYCGNCGQALDWTND